MLSDVNFTIRSGGRNASSGGAGRQNAKVGVATGGNPGTVYSFGSSSAAVAALHSGPLLEAIISTLSEAGGPVLASCCEPVTAGTIGATTHTGTGVGTCAGSDAPHLQVRIKISTAGDLGAGKFVYALGDGDYCAAEIPLGTPGPWTYRVPGTLLKVTFPAGAPYVKDEVYTFTTSGTITKSGAGPVVTKAASPTDSHAVVVNIVGTGTLGTAQFTYSLDGGNNFSAPIMVPGTGIYPIIGTGVVLTFAGGAGAFVDGDTYTIACAAAGCTSTEITAAFNVLKADSRRWFLLHVVGTPANAAAAASLAGTMSTLMETAATSFRFSRCLIECPTSEVDATVVAAFASFAGDRVLVGAGDYLHISPNTGRKLRRNAAWQIASRAARLRPGQDVAEVAVGALAQVQTIYRDEFTTPALDAGRFCTLRTYVGQAGYYVSNANIMCGPGSDYTLLQYGRCMDVACDITRDACVPMLNGNVRLNKTGPRAGCIIERDADRYEKSTRQKLVAGMVNTGDITDVDVTFDRDTNLIIGGDEPIAVSILPLGYLKSITATMAFANPAL